MMHDVAGAGEDGLPVERQQDFGVLYYVDDNPRFRKMAAVSIESVQRHHPDWPICVQSCRHFPVSVVRRLYRAVSFWKWSERRRRAHQDWRVLFSKAYGWLESPFKTTLYLDVDTVLMRPLTNMVASHQTADVVATLLKGKSYKGFLPWQPDEIPMVMSGVVLFREPFRPLYRNYIEKLRVGAGKRFAGDQYMFSTLCALESDKLKIALDETLQIDAMNFAGHFGRADFPCVGGVLDLRTDLLAPFHVFHYNGPHKQDYLRQIADVWGYTGAGADVGTFMSPSSRVDAPVPHIL